MLQNHQSSAMAADSPTSAGTKVLLPIPDSMQNKILHDECSGQTSEIKQRR